MTINKLPPIKEKQKINTKGLNELAKKVREVLIKEDKYAQKKMKNGSSNVSKLNYLP